MNMLHAVKEFHERFGVHISKNPRLDIPEKTRRLRLDLLTEEFEEYLEAESNDDLIQIADALADMCYIICGTALTYGIPLNEVFREVHRSNMAKIGGPTREDGKILKPKGWQPPNIAGALDSFLCHRCNIRFFDYIELTNHQLGC